MTFCGQLCAIDGMTVMRISRQRDVAAKVLGRERANAALKEELAQRHAKVKEFCEARWCADKRVAFSERDVRTFRN